MRMPLTQTDHVTRARGGGGGCAALWGCHEAGRTDGERMAVSNVGGLPQHRQSGGDRGEGGCGMRMPLTPTDHVPRARGGETALSPERRCGSPFAAAKEGVRGGAMGSPTLAGYHNIVRAVETAAKAGAA